LDTQTEQLNQKLCQYSALNLAMLILAGTILRPFFSEQSIIFTIIGFINFILAFAFYWSVRSGWIVESAGVTLVAIALICMMPLVLISGGINSQFIILLPLVPIGTSFICRNRMVIWVTISLIAIVVAMYIFNHKIHDLDKASISNAKLMAKSFWIVIALIVSGFLGRYYRVQNSKFQKKLREYAFFDALTEIPNRRHIQELITKEITQAKRTDNPLGIMLLDIDFFKNVNDNFGHDTGDIVLKHVAKTLKELIRESDYVGRFGGEEFILIFPNTPAELLTKMGENIVKKIARLKIEQLKNEYQITVSIGGYVTDKSNNANEKSTIKAADEALYYCKEHGRNQFFLASNKLSEI
jgi:diguanylate cyclase (GGDEF)-like protein